jgi:hypothetical protein
VPSAEIEAPRPGRLYRASKGDSPLDLFRVIEKSKARQLTGLFDDHFDLHVLEGERDLAGQCLMRACREKQEQHTKQTHRREYFFVVVHNGFGVSL